MWFAQVWLVAIDDAGNAQGNATHVTLKTAPDTTPPALLAGSGANGVRPLLVPVAQPKQCWAQPFTLATASTCSIHLCSKYAVKV